MTEHLCACGRPAPTTTICQSCADRLAHDLGDVPAYAAELDTVLARQTRYGEQNSTVKASNITLPFDLRASEASWVLRNTLVGWIRVLDETGVDWPDGSVEAMSRWLLVRVDLLARHEAGDQAADEVGSAMALVRRVVDRPADLLYAGPCDDCGADLYARPTAAQVRCRGRQGTACDAVYDVEDRREYLLAELEDKLAAATEIARAVSALGQPVTAAMVRGYAFRGRLEVRGMNLRGDPLYRVGDVLGLLRQPKRDETRRVSA